MTRLAAPPQLGRDGRLGNQLFMVSVTCAVAWRTGATPTFPDDWRYRHVWPLPDDWFIHRDRVAELPNVVDHPAAAHLAPRWRHYLQDVALLTPVAQRLRAMWSTLTPAAAARFNAAALTMFGDLTFPVLSVHVRRGDNVTNEAGTINLLDPGYYPAAARVAQSAISPPPASVAIFSDDPDWCEDHADQLGAPELRRRVWHGTPRSKETDPAYQTEPADEWVDLMLGARCTAHVLSNSTFAWWSAWLSSNPHPVYPSYWVGEQLTGAGFSPARLFPPGWTRIPATCITPDDTAPVAD